MRKILFFDFDGVLNHNGWWICPPNGCAIHPGPAHVATQMFYAASTVVVTSFWARWMYRHGLTKDAFSELLCAFGLSLSSCKIEHFGEPRNSPQERAKAIADFLATVKEPYGYAVVDDMDMAQHMSTDMLSRFLRVDSRFMLRNRDFDTVNKMMNRRVQ